MADTDPRAKAIEAVGQALVGPDTWREWRELDVKVALKCATELVEVAEPHIRFQAFIELAEEFEHESALSAASGWAATAHTYADVATHCRELAAKEKHGGR